MANPSLPFVSELVPAPAPEDVFGVLSGYRHCLFLDSALRHPTLGRYSFVAAEPFDYLQVPAGRTDGLTELGARLRGLTTTRRRTDLPPFQGGVAGLFSYELGRGLEAVGRAAFDEFEVPGLAVGFYDVVVAFDHAVDRAWIISQGLPATEPAARLARAAARAATVQDWIAGGRGRTARRPASPEPPPVGRDQLAPQVPAPGLPGLLSNFTAAGYRQAVARVIDYIRAGDVFQVNLSQRLLFPQQDSSVPLYRRLRAANPAPFAAYFDLGRFQLCSASPERFLQVVDRQVETRPIKGTRPRTGRPEADLFAADDLRQSEKDRAENVMIVDLLRNDLSKVCCADSVRVHKLWALETYAYVQHLVSVIHGRLRRGATSLDLLRAAFPGGSITGAPKIRAMEIIAELEPTARGAYCGAIGYLGFDGTLDTNILIRTITAGRGWWQIPVGGGIVAQSVPEDEYEETWHKAEGMVQALRP